MPDATQLDSNEPEMESVAALCSASPVGGFAWSGYGETVTIISLAQT